MVLLAILLERMFCYRITYFFPQIIAIVFQNHVESLRIECKFSVIYSCLFFYQLSNKPRTRIIQKMRYRSTLNSSDQLCFLICYQLSLNYNILKIFTIGVFFFFFLKSFKNLFQHNFYTEIYILCIVNNYRKISLNFEIFIVQD